jgi:hypothetical protein
VKIQFLEYHENEFLDNENHNPSISDIIPWVWDKGSSTVSVFILDEMYTSRLSVNTATHWRINTSPFSACSKPLAAKTLRSECPKLRCTPPFLDLNCSQLLTPDFASLIPLLSGKKNIFSKFGGIRGELAVGRFLVIKISAVFRRFSKIFEKK